MNYGYRQSKIKKTMNVIHLDFETFSTIDLRKVGAYRYAEHESTEVLVAGYSLNTGPIKQWEPRVQKIHTDLHTAFNDDEYLIIAHNAEFERCIIEKVLGYKIPRTRYRCTAARAAAAGLPRSLDGALAATNNVVRKDKPGANALRQFSRPRKPTKKNPAIRLLPEDDPEKWALVLNYNRIDVKAEKALDKSIPDLSPREWKYYHYICKVNDRGLPLDVKSLEGAAQTVGKLEKINATRVRKLTKGINPTQVEKLRLWINEQGVELENLQLKTIITTLRDNLQLSPKVREILTLRLEASRASTKKIKAMLDVVCHDGRAHGTVLYHGAATGRLTGKLIQPLNFTRGLLDSKKTEGAVQSAVIDLFASGDADLVNSILYHQPDDTPLGTPPVQGPMSMLAQSMRGFICAPKGYYFLIADYAAIEARLLAFMANEVKLLIAYRNGVDTYKMMASVLYNIPIEEVTDEQRRIGKNLTLGAGYQLGAPKLIEHCEKEEIFINLDFAKKAINAYRMDKPNIVRSWSKMEEAAIQAMQTGRQVQGLKDKSVYFEHWKDWLLMILPSGRKVHYYLPEVDTVVKFGKPKLQLSYMGEKSHKWGRVSTYGGKLIENLMQAMARDIMMHGMMESEAAGYPALINIYDEEISIRKEGEGNIEELTKALCTMPRWAHGIPLTAAGFTAMRYRKG